MMTHAVKFLQLVEDAKLRIRETTVDEVNDDLDAAADFVLVDTREESEWAAGHAAGAIHLGKGIIERDIEKNDTGCLEEDRSLLRRRISLRTCRRCARKDGLSQRVLVSRRLAGMEGRRSAD